MTIARQGTRAFTRKCQAQVQKEDASIMGPRGVIEIWGHFLVIHQITPITDGFMKLRSSFSRELTFIIPQEITKECVGLTPPCDFHGGFRVIFMGDHIYIYTQLDHILLENSFAAISQFLWFHLNFEMCQRL